MGQKTGIPTKTTWLTLNTQKPTKYIVVTGGVLSGLGKGIAAASIGQLLSNHLKVIAIKCDGYLNTDPGTMNPIEHGEVFVLDDGGEVDMDFGHYERFLNVTAKSHWNLTMGKVFKKILEQERRGDYLGKTVQFIPHVTQAIKDWFYQIEKEEKPDVALIEVGGTIGDLENQFYIEAIRQFQREVGSDNMVHVHLTYVPVPSGVGEQKSKPTQMSVRLLNEKGIEPDVIIGRCSEYLTKPIKEKIASYCNLPSKAVISGVDVESIYENPLVYEQEQLTSLLQERLGIDFSPDLENWGRWVQVLKNNQSKPQKSIRIAICGKYTALEDSYASVVESLVHCEAHLNVKIDIQWIETSEVEDDTRKVAQKLQSVHGVIIPGGFGGRGIEGKIQIIQYIRENNIPFLGICYGMQLAVVEFARNCCGLPEANTTEVQEDCKDPVVTILPNQKNVTDMGGTMRLGGHDIVLKPGTRAHTLFGKQSHTRNRFRHRYEVNPKYIEIIESKGMVFSGKAKDEDIMQILELPKHPCFLACQFHPELTSNLREPSPLFYELVKAAIDHPIKE